MNMFKGSRYSYGKVSNDNARNPFPISLFSADNYKNDQTKYYAAGLQLEPLMEVINLIMVTLYKTCF